MPKIKKRSIPITDSVDDRVPLVIHLKWDLLPAAQALTI
jgi:hypothetical protein